MPYEDCKKTTPLTARNNFSNEYNHTSQKYCQHNLVVVIIKSLEKIQPNCTQNRGRKTGHEPVLSLPLDPQQEPFSTDHGACTKHENP